jgi:hypothetical protein
VRKGCTEEVPDGQGQEEGQVTSVLVLDGSAWAALSVTEDVLPLGLGRPEQAVVVQPVVARGFTVRPLMGLEVLVGVGLRLVSGIVELLCRRLPRPDPRPEGEDSARVVVIHNHVHIGTCLLGGGPCVGDRADVDRTGHGRARTKATGAANDAV